MIKGHPKGLVVLFGAEMFERLCYYGMRSLLILYLTKALMQGDTEAIGIYGAYTALVFAAPVAGGKLADAVLGYRRAVIFGGIVMALGEFMILGGTQEWLYLGMATIIIGNGFFKANISTIVGRLYKDGDPLRDSGFTIFYMGINIGALLATVAIAPIGEKFGYEWGFGLAGVGMLVGVAIFIMGQGRLEGHGEPADPEALAKYGKLVYGGALAAIPGLYYLITYSQKITFLGQGILFWLLMLLLVYVCFNLLREGFKGDNVQRDRIIVLMILMVFNVVFWACFEQAGSSLTLFADRNVDRMIGGYEMPASQTQFFNPAFIILFGSIFSVMWVKLSQRGKNPSIPMKFGLGIVQLGLGYLMLLAGVTLAGPEAMVPLFVLGLMYLLHTTGELFLSPIGLSMVTKLAPKHMTGSVMGAWFLSFAFSMYLAAVLAKLTGGGEGEVVADLTASESLATYVDLFGNMGFVTVGIGVLLMLLSKPLTKMMHGVE
ncbi:MAG: oligopeptide:H+ symporter [Candidatus Krumholzibacteria bacterium]|nr:oligopeptide:H+ symporter [Candidatus Krumholzibacteria bacterium]